MLSYRYTHKNLENAAYLATFFAIHGISPACQPLVANMRMEVY